VATPFLDNVIDGEMLEAGVLSESLTVRSFTYARCTSDYYVWLASHDVFGGTFSIAVYKKFQPEGWQNQKIVLSIRRAVDSREPKQTPEMTFPPLRAELSSDASGGLGFVLESENLELLKSCQIFEVLNSLSRMSHTPPNHSIKFDG
jgi:hypothetical protein